MKRIAVVLAWIVLGGVALAQSVNGPNDPLRRALSALEVDATAIVDGASSVPIDTIQQLAGDINFQARQLPALGPDDPVVKRIEVSLTEAVGRLVADAGNQDAFAAASDARDVLDNVTRLRSVLGLSH